MTEKHERRPVISEDMSRLLSKHALRPRMPQDAPNYQVIDWTSIRDIGFAASN